jgi:hypothetical protein
MFLSQASRYHRLSLLRCKRLRQQTDSLNRPMPDSAHSEELRLARRTQAAVGDAFFRLPRVLMARIDASVPHFWDRLIEPETQV